MVLPFNKIDGWDNTMHEVVHPVFKTYHSNHFSKISTLLLLVVLAWMSYLTSGNLSILICTMEITNVPPSEMAVRTK